ncbi:maltose permease [Sporothrix curviconia]|uniref:Maltose permease n=1 Tax=Sporothrix curviconia TaxID=1260050 RepID=A0ABP0BL95_9PEZI
MVAMCTNWGGNAINSQTGQFLELAGLHDQVWASPVFITGMMITSVFLISIGVLGCVKQTTSVSNAIDALLVVGTIVYILTVASCSYTIIGEVPSSNPRAKTIVLSLIAFNASGIIVNVLLPLMLTGGAWNLGAKTAFMFAATNTLLWIWCLFCLPMTKDRTFYEIDWLFNESGLSARKWRKAKVDGFDDGNGDTVAQHENIAVKLYN